MLPRILIVEDEAILADAIATYLERHAYTIVVASSGEDGLRLASEHRPDVAVVDSDSQASMVWKCSSACARCRQGPQW